MSDNEEFNSLSHQEVAVLETVHALSVAGISPISVEQVRVLASSGSGAAFDPPVVNVCLAQRKTRPMAFRPDF